MRAHRSRWPGTAPEAEARVFAERTARLLTASVLLRTAPPEVGAGYAPGRLDLDRGCEAGTVAGLDARMLLDRVAGREN